MDGPLKKMHIKLKPDNIVLSFCICGMAAIFSSTLSKTPALPLFASHLGASEAQVGLIAAASTIPGLFMSYLAGSLSDRYGWKRILIISLLLFATAPFLYLLAKTPLQLAAARFYHGFATAVFGPVAMAAVTAYSGERKGEMLSFYSSSTILGRAAAPFAGGFLLAAWGFQGVFAVSALAGAAALVTGALYWGRLSAATGTARKPQSRSSGSMVDDLRHLLRHRIILLVGYIEATVFFAYGAFEVLFPLYARKQGLEVWHIGVIMGLQLAGVVFLKPIFGRLSDRTGRMPVILAGLALSALSAAGIPFWNTIHGFGVLNIAFGLGFALVTSGTRPLAAEAACRGKLGASMGLLSTLMDVGQAAGPPAVGIISMVFGYQAGFLAMAGLLITSFIVAGLHAKTACLKSE